MATCMDYIKGGEVLIAPRLEYKYQYLLKCNECEECYCLLGPFITHCSSHFGMNSSATEISPNYSPNEGNNEMYVYPKAEEGEPGELKKLKREPVELVKDEDPLTYNDMEYLTDNEENESIDELQGDETNATMDYLDCGPEDTEHGEQTNDATDDIADGDYEQAEDGCWEDSNESNEDADDTDASECSNVSASVRQFMTSKANVVALIGFYKNQSNLWNNNYSQLRSTERLKCKQLIANDVQNQLNVIVSTKQVSRMIVQLRRKYRLKLEGERANGSVENNRKDAWLYDSLSFLKPFFRKKSIAVIEPLTNDLTHEQILQILNIYKRYPQLWNTDTMENCCKSKRSEALGLMRNDIEEQVNIKVDENALKKYLHCLHVYFSQQKRRDMGILKTKEPRFEYYDHMKFLYDYLGPFKCSTCKRLFQSPLHLKAHRHDGSLNLKCPQCKKGYKSVENYIAHVRRHMNDLGIKCKECGKGFLRTADLKIHMRAHTGAKPFFCDVCGASFRHSQAFNVHKRRHVKEYSHICTVCSKGCYTKHELNNHVRIHRDVREFACDICGKAFKTKKTLQQHTSIHKEVRNHICSICGKGFKNRIGLGQHLKTHGRNTAVSLDLNSLLP